MGICECGPRITNEHSWSDHGKTQMLGMIILMRIHGGIAVMGERGKVIMEKRMTRCGSLDYLRCSNVDYLQCSFV